MDRYALRLTAFVFFYVLIVGALVQGIVLPQLFPSWHAGDGLLKGHDWVSYHKIATELADQIRREGWKVWELRPRGHGWIEPGLTAAVYAVTVSKPWVLLPFNALIHAASAFLLYQIFFCITGKRGFLTVVATAPFVLFPSALLWTVQIHKDGAAILGLLLCLWGWVFLLPGWRGKHASVTGSLLIVVGFLIAFIVRSYWGELLLVLSKVGVVLFVVMEAIKKIGDKKAMRAALRHWVVPSVFLFLVIPISIGEISFSLGDFSFQLPRWFKDGEQLGAPLQRPESSTTSKPEKSSGALFSPSGLLQRPVEPKLWKLSFWLPYGVDAKLAQIARIRRGFNADQIAQSKIDSFVEFGSASEFVSYFPRAFQIAFFAPFPNQWFASGHSEFSGSLRKLVGLEMLFFWVLLPFAGFFVFKYRRNPFLWVCVVTCFSFTLLFVYSIPTMGTVHRFRYVFHMVFAGFGILGMKERGEESSLMKGPVPA